ncbi:MAG: hypothetical protein FD144_5934 [Rhodospirillaceae bacterium]|nr:MAG: hypothetical protein FD144_5934 [Rhodospirillaceae bacterium]
MDADENDDDDEKFSLGDATSVASPSYYMGDASSRDATPRPEHPKLEEELEPEAGDEYATVVHPQPLRCAVTHVVRSRANEKKAPTPDMTEGEYVLRDICSLSFLSLV